eukprot:6045488-Ditylum_brightwellii.AAC.1
MGLTPENLGNSTGGLQQTEVVVDDNAVHWTSLSMSGLYMGKQRWQYHAILKCGGGSLCCITILDAEGIGLLVVVVNNN